MYMTNKQFDALKHILVELSSNLEATGTASVSVESLSALHDMVDKVEHDKEVQRKKTAANMRKYRKEDPSYGHKYTPRDIKIYNTIMNSDKREEFLAMDGVATIEFVTSNYKCSTSTAVKVLALKLISN